MTKKINTTNGGPEEEGKETLALRYSFIQPNISGLEGKILTIIDASIVGEQNDAIKSLIKKEVGQTISWIHEVAHSDLSQAKEGYSSGRPFPEQTVEIIQ